MFTAEDKLKCAKREVALRERNYRRWVTRGDMKQAMADHEIAVMKEIVADYAILARKEKDDANDPSRDR